MSFVVGLEFGVGAGKPEDHIASAILKDGYGFVSIPLVDSDKERDLKGDASLRETMGDFTHGRLSGEQWSNCIIGRTSKWINLDSEDKDERLNSERALQQEVSWAEHLGINAIILPAMDKTCTNFASYVTNLASEVSYTSLLVPIDLADADGKGQETWEGWNLLCSASDHCPRILPILNITKDLPSDECIERWLGENCCNFIVDAGVFLANKKGFPVLPKVHQQFFHKFMIRDMRVVVTGVTENQDHYVQYLQHLKHRQPPLSQSEMFEQPYWDVLQAPLQPLMDNLGNSTYETFERDPVKYREYERAIALRLSEMERDDENPIVVMVVGAGRGPLVDCALRASASEEKPIRVFAVEKNPNAVVTLQHRNKNDWGGVVTIVEQDMREYTPPELADILVSELLGSFGDNELSPECLDGAQRLLKPDTGISIPCDYTAYIAPVCTSRLWSACRTSLKDLETPYVVRLMNVFQLAPPKKCWDFKHPNSESPPNNNRSCSLSFQVGAGGMCHGFAGYFHSTLYKDVHISIEPSTFSTGMFSWFPLYFPLARPTTVPPGETIACQFWRRVSHKKRSVWYEWSMTAPQKSHVHNVAARSYYVGL